MLQVRAFTVTFAMTSSPLHVVIWTRETSMLGFAMLRHCLPLRIKNDFGRNWRVFTFKSLTSEKSMISVAPVVGHLQISLRMIWRISSPNMLSLA